MAEEKKTEPQSQKTAEGTFDSYDYLIGRFLWAGAGPMAWLVVFLPIGKGPGWLTIWEPIYLVILGVMVWGRYLEQKSGKGTTLYGEPTTWQHFRSYTVKLLVLSSVCWGAAKLIGKSMNGW